MTERLAPGDRAPDVALYSTSGDVVRTAELWAEGPAVVAFLRHFGWPFCKDHLAQLREEPPRFADAGARLAGVFMGPPPSVGDFCGEREMPFDCLADPDRSAYRAFGLARGSPRQWLVGGGVIKGAARLLRKGVAAGLPHTGQDVRQMPGTFVVARGGTLRLAHYNRDSADDPPVDRLLGALGAV